MLSRFCSTDQLGAAKPGFIWVVGYRQTILRACHPKLWIDPEPFARLHTIALTNARNGLAIGEPDLCEGPAPDQAVLVLSGETP